MIPTKIRVGLVLLALVGCRDKPPEMAKLSEVMPNLPLPPNAKLLSRAGGSDALKLTLVSTVKAPEVEAYYRHTLSRNGWHLVNDARDQEGAVVLLAKQQGPPLWVRIKSTSDSTATVVELAGALVKPRPSPKPAS
jgi:hypothetical protein